MKDKKQVNPGDTMDPFGMAGNLIFAWLAGDTAKLYNYLREARNVLLSPMNTGIATTPYEVVYEEDRVKLKYYKPDTEPRLTHPFLIVYAQVNRETMLDLQPRRSVVETFLNAGLDFYMIDWGYPTRKDRYLTLDDHINGYIDNIVEFILEKHKMPKLHLMGICQGGTFCVAYTALHPEKIKNLVTTVTPTNFDTDDSLLNIWSRALNPDELVEAYGNIPGDIMNLGFLLLNPARLMIDKYVGFLENVNNFNFVENFVRMERWIFDSPDLPAETFREFITNFYKKNLLMKNELEVGGKKVDLKKITMPVLNIYAKYDHLVPPAACNQFISKIGSQDKEDLCLDTGHIGIYVSSKTQKEFGPKIIRWLMERDGNGQERKTSEKVRVKKPVPKKVKRK
jgi:polyhydroxyalkanoate synthase